MGPQSGEPKSKGPQPRDISLYESLGIALFKALFDINMVIFADFKGSKQHWARDLEKLGTKYGPVFTFWLGNKPIVIIDDIDVTKEVNRTLDFAGRPKDFLCESTVILLNE